MRITQSTITRNYLRNMENNNRNKFDSSNRITSGAKFTRASQDPIAAAKALTVRKSLNDLETYSGNLTTAKGIYSAAESVIMSISEIMTSISERTVYAANGTQSQTERDIIAQEIEGYADQMLKLFNSDKSGRKLFGGTNNETSAFEFVEDAVNGKRVTYNGKDLTDFSTNPDDYPNSEKVIFDIGVDIQVSKDGVVDPQTGMQISFNGAEVTGCGKDGEGDSKNYIQLALDITKALRDGSPSKAIKLSDKLTESKSNLYMQIANIGNAERFIEFNENKITNEEYNLKESQNSLEVTDMPTEMTYYKVLSATYSATLQMAASVIPQSIFNFIN